MASIEPTPISAPPATAPVVTEPKAPVVETPSPKVSDDLIALYRAENPRRKITYKGAYTKAFLAWLQKIPK